MGWDERQIHTTSLTFSGEAAISMCVDRKTIFVVGIFVIAVVLYCRDCCCWNRI